MQEVIVVKFCDYPGCEGANREASPSGQEVLDVDFWVNATKQGGRKSKPIAVEMCEAHAAQMRALYLAMKPRDLSGA